MLNRRQKNQRFFSYNLFSKDRKGVSGVVAMVLMITLVIVVVGVVWVVVNNLVSESIESTESCFGIFDKVKITTGYTCYNSSSEELQFSISVGDITVDELLVSVSSEGTSTSFKLSSDAQESYLKNYGVGTNYGEILIFPGKNSGRTYVFNMTNAGLSGIPDSIEIAPIIEKKQCGVSDSISEFDNCLLLS